MLFENDIRLFVRARLAELSSEGSDMFFDENDDRNLDEIVLNLIGESVTYCHLKAPVTMIEGEELTEESEGMLDCVSIKDSVLDVDLRKLPDVNVLRLASFQSKDSDIVVTIPVEEDSPMGRMQLNEYIRGVYDAPVLVHMHDSENYHPHYRYYTVKIATNVIAQFSLRYFAVPERKAEMVDGIPTQNYYWDVSSKLTEAVLNHITGMTLRTYNVEDKAQIFLARAVEYMQ